MKKIHLLSILCMLHISAFATRYFPSSATAPYAGTAQTVCIGSANTATTINYAVCGTTSGTAAQTLTVTPTWLLNGAVVYTGAQFVTVAGGGSITLPAAAFTYPTAGTYTGANGLECKLTWTTAAPAACTAGSTTITGTSTTITVLPTPVAIGGSSNVCPGGLLSLTDASGGGTWSSGNSTVATIVPATGVLHATASGAAVITYSNGCGTAATKTVTVVSSPGAIAGPSSVCAGSTITLSNPITGGVWSSSTSSVATVVAATGVVQGTVAGTTTISYACGTSTTAVVTVIGAPVAITGPSSLCHGSTITLSDATAGGTWSTSNSTVATVGSTTGVVTGGTGTSATITYSTGCGTALTKVITITPAPGTIIGSLNVCTGLTTTLSDAVTGGTWSSNNSSVATIGPASGIVSGSNSGNATITYSTGCGTDATALLTVAASSPGTITGTTVVCTGATTRLSDGVTGGVWSIGNSSLATVSTSGVVTGVHGGTTPITYSVTYSCGVVSTTTTISVDTLPQPPPIQGYTSPICAGTTLLLYDPAPGNDWSSGNTTVAMVDTSGVVTGWRTGSALIYYAVTNGCGRIATAITVIIDSTPVVNAITGSGSICPGSTLSLNNSTTGGAWSSASPSVAIVGSTTGVVTAVSNGNAVISYSVSNNCGMTAATATVTVNSTSPPPGTITGIDSICINGTITLSENVAGGTWSSDYPSIGIVSSMGVFYASYPGTDTVRYHVLNGCGSAVAKKAIIVSPCYPASVNASAAVGTELKIFPNPTSGTFSINLLSGISEEVHVVIISATGEKIQEFSTPTNRENILKLNIAAGIYFVSAKTDHDLKVTRMVITN